MNKVKVRIVGDGTLGNTHIFDANTGEEIDGVRSIQIRFRVNETPEVKLEIYRAELDITAEADIEVVPVPVNNARDVTALNERWAHRIVAK